jgi:hypothetical protein
MSNFDVLWLRVEYIASEIEDLEGGWRKLHTEKLHNLELSPDIVRAIWDGHIQEEIEGEVTYLSIQCQSHTEQGLKIIVWATILGFNYGYVS